MACRWRRPMAIGCVPNRERRRLRTILGPDRRAHTWHRADWTRESYRRTPVDFPSRFLNEFWYVDMRGASMGARGIGTTRPISAIKIPAARARSALKLKPPEYS